MHCPLEGYTFRICGGVVSEDGTCSGSPREPLVVSMQPGGGPVLGVLLEDTSEGVYHLLIEEELLEGKLYILMYQKFQNILESMNHLAL